jgi:hypothetical protein
MRLTRRFQPDREFFWISKAQSDGASSFASLGLLDARIFVAGSGGVENTSHEGEP